MKTTKRLLSCLLVLAMLFALAIPAFAAGGTITIKNTEAGTVYTLYKLFDVQKSEAGTVSYTLVNGLSETDLEGSPFTVEAGHIVDKTGAQPSDDWFQTVAAKLTAVDTKTSAGKDVVFTTNEDAYYFITRSTSKTVSAPEFNAETVVSDITIFDKNNNNDPVPGKPEGGRYKTTADGADISVDLGGKVNFTVSFNTSNYAKNPAHETDANAPAFVTVDKYTVLDTPSGIDIDLEKLTVTVGGDPIAKTAYTATKADDGKVAVEIPWKTAEGNPIYAQGAEVVISYEGTVTEKNATNKATITPTVNGEDGTPKEDPTPVNVKSADIVITKVDADDNTVKLDGAKFVLINKNAGEDNGKYYKYTAAAGNDPAKVEWVADIKDATEVTTGGKTLTGADGVKGIATFEGLAAGSYELKETVAPNGYNLMDQLFAVTVNEDGKGEAYAVSCDGATIENARGTLLPSTGGIGTTMFYVIGGILVAAAVVVLVSKKRMGAEQ